jgi:hypothetical protein
VKNEDGAGPATGLVAVNEYLPAELELVSMDGPNWLCDGALCERDGVLPGGRSFEPITVKVNVKAAAGQVVNQASVSGGDSMEMRASDVISVKERQ